MTMWLAIGLVGLGSYAFRVVPMLLGERMQFSERTDAAFRHASVGAITALLVMSVQRTTSDPFSPDSIAVGLALAMSGTVALRGRSMPVVVLCGAATYGLTLGVAHVLFA
jgi:branched-subunit amino acid transport protein